MENYQPGESHLFNIDAAVKYGVESAIMIRLFQFWIEHNKSHGKNLIEGRTWTYISVRAITETFPYWSIQNIRTILERLLKEKILIKRRMSGKGYNRTAWYAFSDEKSFVKTNKCLEKSFVKTNKSICQNQQMHLLESTNPFVRTNKLQLTIPINNKQLDKTVPADLKKSQEILALDLKIAEGKVFLANQIEKILRPSARERNTFAAAINHLVRECQAGRLDIGIFRDASEWARASAAANVRSPKALFIAKMKKETGFAAQKALLKKI